MAQYNGKHYGLALRKESYAAPLMLLNLPAMTQAQAMAYRKTAELIAKCPVCVVNLRAE